MKERAHWDRYRACYEEAISATSTARAPWYIVPADQKWYTRLIVSKVIIETLKGLDLKYPDLSPEQKENLAAYRMQLLAGSS